MIKLKPCPFCGGEAGLYHGDSTDGYIKGTRYVEAFCGWCGARIREKKEDEVIKKWNTRPNPWHTGTPTEEGKYLCWVSFPDVCKDGEDSWKCKWLNGEWIDDEVNGKIPLNNLGFKVIAWQKIEPYKEK